MFGARAFARTTLPSTWYDGFRALRGGDFAAARPVIARNHELHGRHAGERCFILGTSPSMVGLDLTFLKDELCVSVASFFLHPDFELIRPRYHCVAPSHAPFTAEEIAGWFARMEPVMSETTPFLGFTDKRLVDEHKLFRNRDVRYLYTPDAWETSTNPTFDLSRPLPQCMSVSLLALMVALDLGCSEIYLLGIDHTQPILDGGFVEYPHFYANDDPSALRLEDQHGDLETHFFSQVMLWRQYKLLRTRAQGLGVAIANASPGGILDLFPRVQYESLFDHA